MAGLPSDTASCVNSRREVFFAGGQGPDLLFYVFGKFRGYGSKVHACATYEQFFSLAELCRKTDTGFIAMKGLAGGLIHNAACAYAFMCQPQYAHVEPIWGIQRERELDEFLSYQDHMPELNEERMKEIQRDQEQLAGEFCRGCGYCMPCPAGIEINNCARMSLMLRRAPQEAWLSEEWQDKMKKIENCLHCGNCRKKCPYGLDTPELLRKNYEDYKTFL